MERALDTFLAGAREKDPVVPDYGRRVAAPRQLRAPDDVLGRPPSDRQALGAGVALSRRTAETRPLLLRAGRGQHDGECQLVASRFAQCRAFFLGGRTLIERRGLLVALESFTHQVEKLRAD